MTTVKVLGMDYGAGSGRGVVGAWDGVKLALHEISRFPNNLVNVNGSIYINILTMFEELKNTLCKARRQQHDISSLAVNTWGVDFGLLDGQNNLIGMPRSYRDPRTMGISTELYKTLDVYELFRLSGNTPVSTWTLFQLLSMKKYERASFDNAAALQFLPNLLSFFLTGNKSCDSTMASVSLLYDLKQKTWNKGLIDTLVLPDIFPELLAHGTVIGRLTRHICEDVGLPPIPVYSIAHHDTASALSVVPFKEKHASAFISCGSISIVGTKLDCPVINPDVLSCGYCNQMGFNDLIDFTKHIPGLLILQECEKAWKEDGYVPDYDSMSAFVENRQIETTFDIDNEIFLYPGNIFKKIADILRQAGKSQPESREEIYASIIHSLAKKYAESVKQLSGLTNRDFNVIHIIGGGARNALLCKLTAHYSGLNVVAGPYEATVIGNIIAQLIAENHLTGVDEVTEVINRSFEPVVYRYN